MHTDGNTSEDSFNIETDINDLEYDIPPVEATPSLESILWALENDEKSNDSGSVYSLPASVPKLNSVLNHCILQGITTQIVSAGERVEAGLPTALANGKRFIAIGTSHGFVLAFDSSQKLCWCSRDSQTADQGAISALAFNMDSTRLLVGYERGYISMLDTSGGDIIRRLPDAHAPQSAVLHLRFADYTGLALCGDSAGCVFSLNFSRRLGMRVWDSKCLFSGARGEVCVFEPLIIQTEEHPLRSHVIVALATLSKVIVISVRPRLKVIFTHALPRLPTSLPLIAWQLVVIQTADQIRVTEPVLAFARGPDLHFYRVQSVSNKRVRLSLLRHVHLSYNLLALHWLGYRHLACLDTTETIRLMDVRSGKEVETLDISEAGLVYGTAHFKALATGGQVSIAFALAGEKACYNSLASRGNQLLILGTKSVQMLRLRAWDERLQFLSGQSRWAEAMNLAADEGPSKRDIVEEGIQSLLHGYFAIMAKHGTDRESLQAAIKCCIKLNKTIFLCNDMWDQVNNDPILSNWYFTIITEHICQGELTSLNPSVSQALVNFHVQEGTFKKLESLLLSLEIDCLDLNQVLKICRTHNLYDAWIHFVTNAMEDYTAPLTELLPILTADNHALGNTMLVYISSCLAGLAYPRGKILPSNIARVKHDILRCLTVTHSNCAKDDELPYPYLRALLKYNTRECLNAVELAFNEAEFAGELGKMQRQRIIQILLQVVTPPEFQDNQIVNLVCFVSRLLTNRTLNADQEMLDTIIKSLTEMVDKPLNLRDHQEREQTWLDLMSAGKLSHIKTKDILEMALKSKCYRVAEILYEQNGKYAEILNCYLKDVHRKNEIFNYMRQHAEDPRRCIKSQLISNIASLIEIDSHQSAHLVIDYYPELLETLSENLKSHPDKLYSLLYEIQLSDTALPPELAEKYLELLLAQDSKSVEAFIKSGNCRPEQALVITQRAKHNFATAFFLEQVGDYTGALELLLEDPADEKCILQAANLCSRGASHLDTKQAEQLWLKLLKKSPNQDILRQLLHSAAQHVRLSVLLEVINSASIGDIKNLLQGLMADSSHETLMLETTFKILGNDLHQNLAKALAKSGQGISINKLVCGLCQANLLDDQSAAVFYCSHIFHERCLPTASTTSTSASTSDIVLCPKCQKGATLINLNIPDNKSSVFQNNVDEIF